MLKHPPQSSILNGFSKSISDNQHRSSDLKIATKRSNNHAKKPEKSIIKNQGQSTNTSKGRKQSRYATVSHQSSKESNNQKQIKNNKQTKNFKTKDQKNEKGKQYSKVQNNMKPQSKEIQKKRSKSQQKFISKSKSRSSEQAKNKKIVQPANKSKIKQSSKNPQQQHKIYPSSVKKQLKRLKPKSKQPDDLTKKLNISIFDQVYNPSQSDPSKRPKKPQKQKKKKHNHKHTHNHKFKVRVKVSQFLEYQAQQQGDGSCDQSEGQDQNLKELINDKVKLKAKDQARVKQKMNEMMAREDQLFYEMILKGELFKKKSIPSITYERNQQYQKSKKHSQQIYDLIDNYSSQQQTRNKKEKNKDKKQNKQDKKQQKIKTKPKSTK